MADVTVQVAGRAYRLGCEDGEEDHLKGLAAAIDEEARRLERQLQGPPDDARLILMTALVMADRLVEAGQRLEAAEAGGVDAAEAEALAARIEALSEAAAGAERQAEAAEAALAEAETRAEAAEAARAEAEAALAETRAAAAEADGSGAEARSLAEAETQARKEAENRVHALESAMAAALAETAELRRALEEAKAGGLADPEKTPEPDLFGEAEDGRAERVAQLARRIEHLTEQISLHLGEG